MSEIDVERAKAAQRAYAKAWRAKNKDKVRNNNLRYWAKRAEREAKKATQPESAEEKVQGDMDV